MFSKLYLLAGGVLMVGYLSVEARGVVFSGTDSKPGVRSASSRRSGGSGRRRRGGGSTFFWGSGYRGGK